MLITILMSDLNEAQAKLDFSSLNKFRGYVTVNCWCEQLTFRLGLMELPLPKEAAT